MAALVPPGSDDATPRRREEPFREFTIVFHDEINVLQAFPQFNKQVNALGIDLNPLSHTLQSSDLDADGRLLPGVPVSPFTQVGGLWGISRVR